MHFGFPTKYSDVRTWKDPAAMVDEITVAVRMRRVVMGQIGNGNPSLKNTTRRIGRYALRLAVLSPQRGACYSCQACEDG
jgi:hypothetical protein